MAAFIRQRQLMLSTSCRRAYCTRFPLRSLSSSLPTGGHMGRATGSDEMTTGGGYSIGYSELGEDSIPMTSGEKLAAKHIEENQSNQSIADTKLKFITSYSEFGDVNISGNTRGYGVFREREADDIAVLVNNFTSPALARALREREELLQSCAHLCEKQDYGKMETLLAPFLKINVDKRRQKQRKLDLTSSFQRKDLVILQRYLHRMPRQVFQAARDRASVMIPLCNDNGKASILFQRRSAKLRRYQYDICFPGGMVDELIDSTIVQTSLRETYEELGIIEDDVDVLGILRCNWTEVATLTGISVTPVVGFIGDMNKMTLTPNPNEVESYFTLQLKNIIDEKNWTIYENSTPIFTSGQYVIYGLTAYLLEKFVKDVVVRCNIVDKE